MNRLRKSDMITAWQKYIEFRSFSGGWKLQITGSV